MKKNITLYVATQKVWGADHPKFHYFETIKERNAFVQGNDYTEVAGTVKLNEAQYEQWKQVGTWDAYAE
jgi:hypothetical protein